MSQSKRGGFNLLIALLATGGLGACADQPELNEATERELREEGATATRALMGMLQANLMAAMKEGGPAHAVEFCAGQALALTDSVAGQLGPGISMKRVSSRHRNPVNAPDAAETKALRHFEETREETGALPEDWVQRTSSGELRYYQPLIIAEPCLACHGDSESLDPAVAEAIRARYPDDRATGYEVGDLRGLIRVSVSHERLGEAADGQG